MITGRLLCLLLLVVTSAGIKEIHVAIKGNTSNDILCWMGGSSNPCDNINLGLHGMYQLSLSRVAMTLVIHEGNYLLGPANYSHFESRKNLTFKAFAGDKVTINCTVGAGLSYANVVNVTFHGVSFVNCGALHNSTSKYLGNITDQKFVLMHATLYFMNCTDVMLDSINISHSLGIAVQFYATVGNNLITRSSFTDNPFPSSGSQGGGVYIEFPYCYPGLIETCGHVSQVTVSNSFFVIQDSLFINNHASISHIEANSSLFYIPNHETFNAFGRGGAISLIFKGTDTKNQVSIFRSQCFGNSALLGGCMYIDCQDGSNSNNITVQDFLMVNNTAMEAGGGVEQRYTTFHNLVRNNAIRFNNCTFKNNSAIWGGGLSMYSGREYKVRMQTNEVSVSCCNFHNNKGTYGSAVSLQVWRSALDGVPIATVFEDSCLFEENVNINSSSSVSEAFGTFLMKYAPAIFKGNATFMRNNGSAIVAIASTIIITENSTINFIENSATQGAAISLLAESYIVMNKGTHYNFMHNSATQRGGAIYAEIEGEKDTISPNCFLTYKDEVINSIDDPKSWDVNVRFVNNTVGNGVSEGQPVCRNGSQLPQSDYIYNAIFATSILSCLFPSNHYEVTLEEKQEVFCWNQDVWQYTCPCPNHEIQTEPSKIVPHGTFYVTPGVNTQVNLTAYDDLEVNVTNFLVLKAESKSSNVTLGTDSKYTSSATLHTGG